jgi:hypothetical protein
VTLRWDTPSGKATRNLTLLKLSKAWRGKLVSWKCWKTVPQLRLTAIISLPILPHDVGVFDAIAETLLPGITTCTESIWELHLGVIAELYKLNVCIDG